MDDIQATAKWANRVLRPLTSIYRRLEKHQETLAIIAAESRAQERDKESKEQDIHDFQPKNAQENYSGSDADEDDPGWIPGKRPDQRRVKHKYSTRGGNKKGRRRTRFTIHSPETTRTLPGAIELATPLITGKRWELPSSAQSQPSVKHHKTSKSYGDVQVFRDRYSLYKSPWQELLDQCGDAGFADIAHNLDRVVQIFLSKTRIVNNSRTTMLNKPEEGARSLLSMVARRLPEYIAIEQEAQDDEDEEGDENMCDAYFTELESFYAPHGKGWKPLREAVRAQGIHLVSEMIQNRWLTNSITYALLDKLCHEQDAFESLLSTFLSTCTACTLPVALRPVADDISPTPSVRLLFKYVYNGPYRYAYIFDEISKLLVRGVLPPEWIATTPWTRWMTRATVSFSKNDCYSAASSQLIEAVLVSACGLFTHENLQVRTQERSTRGRTPRFRTTRISRLPTSSLDINRKCPVPVEDALSNHVISVLATLCGMHISRSRKLDASNGTNSTEAGHLVNHVCFAVKRQMEAEPLPHILRLPSRQLLRRGCILLADCLLQCNDAVLADTNGPFLISTTIVEEFSRALVPRSDLIKEMALFVRQAFRCFSSSEDTDMRGEIRRIVSRLPYLTEATELSMLLGRVAVEAAMEFAEGTGDPDDHLWAVEIQETNFSFRNRAYSSLGSASESEGSAPKRGLFRWEDGIGEWVARTPTIQANPTATGSKRRASAIISRSPCIRGSTDISSPASDNFENHSPILTSSPSSSVGTEQHVEAVSSSPIRPFKQRCVAPRVVNDQTRPMRSESPSDRSPSRSPSLEPVPSHRRVLRDMSTHIIANPTRSMPPSRPTSKVEVVIINKTQPRPAARPVSEHVEKQVHRTRTRARPGRPSILHAPSPCMVPRSQSVIPCSQDDSDDELSFF